MAVSPEPTDWTALATWRRGISGLLPGELLCWRLWLIVLAILSTFIVGLALSTYQVRARLSAQTIGKTSVTVWLLQTAREQLRNRETKNVISEFTAKIFGRPDSQVSLSTVQTRVDQNQEKLAAFSRDTHSAAWRVELALRKAGTKPGESRTPQDINRERATQLSDAVDRTQGLDDQVRKDLAHVLEGVAEIEHLRQQIAMDEKRKEKLIEDDKRREKERQESMLRLVQEITGDTTMTQADALRFRNSLAEFYSLAAFGIWPRLSEVLLVCPIELLTIIIVVFGGILGSTMSIGRDVFFSTEGCGKRSFLSPVFGGLVALVLFIAVKAGVLVAVDQRSATDATTELNPFFITFLGIIAGALAEQVVEKVRSTGGDWLRTSAVARPRWCIGGAALMASEADRNKVAGYLAVEPARVHAILKGEVAADTREQTVIAAYLQQDTAQLFTDLAPQRPSP